MKCINLIETRSSEELEQIAQELYDIVRQKGVTLREAEQIFGAAERITRNSPGVFEPYEKWRNTIVT
jgi:hypothetical protein